MEIKPDLSEFVKLAGSYNIVPVWAEALADLETPVSVFMKLSDGTPSFLLESVEQGENLGRYSFIGINPVKTFKTKQNSMEITCNGDIEKRIFAGDPLKELQKIFMEYRQAPAAGLPALIGGAVGYASYDYVRFLEKLPSSESKKNNFPDLYFQICSDIIAFDHVKRKIIVISNAFTGHKNSPEKSYENARANLKKIMERLRSPLQINEPRMKPGNDGFVSNFTKKDFKRMVTKAKKYIKAGDIIQVVPSQRWEKKLDVAPFGVYRALRYINPSPYMFFLHFPEIRLIGSSPEILVRLHGSEAVLRPIAGTRKRGTSDKEDVRLENELKKDTKEIAEHVMLVDLGRNDLGRVCKYGTVRVSELMTVEKYSHVMHLVSNVTGKMQHGKNQFDLLRACFPAGTVSGAPKVRAMEIIEELEPVDRGPYAGAVGYFGFSGNMDFCITIRTFFSDSEKIYVQAGGGIVADSVPENEYHETLNKSLALKKSYELARTILEDS